MHGVFYNEQWIDKSFKILTVVTIIHEIVQCITRCIMHRNYFYKTLYIKAFSKVLPKFVKYNPGMYLTGFVRPKLKRTNLIWDDVADYDTSFVFTFC